MQKKIFFFVLETIKYFEHIIVVLLNTPKSNLQFYITSPLLTGSDHSLLQVKGEWLGL